MNNIEAIVFPSTLDLNRSEKGDSYKRNYLKLTFYKHRARKNQREVFSQTSRVEDIISPILYLPIAPRLLVESISATYSPEDIGVLGNLLYANINEFGITTDGLKKALQNTVDAGTLGDALSGIAMSELLRTDFNAVKAGTYAEGVAYNPNTTTFYQGSSQSYRLFYFTWNLYPKSKEEAVNLRKIENVFKRNTLPSTINSSIPATVNYNNHYEYPSKLLMEIYVDNAIYGKFKFLPAVITKLDISHNDVQNQNEMAFFEEDGEKFYTSTSISLAVQETKVFTRKDIDKVHIL